MMAIWAIPSKVVLIEGAAHAIARARQLGYKVVTISNQSGVARGMFSEADVVAVDARMEELLREENREAIIDHREYCPFHPKRSSTNIGGKANCESRSRE